MQTTLHNNNETYENNYIDNKMTKLEEKQIRVFYLGANGLGVNSDDHTIV